MRCLCQSLSDPYRAPLVQRTSVGFFLWWPSARDRLVFASDYAHWDWDAPDWKDLANPDTGAVGFTFGKALSDANKATVQKFIAGLGDGSINLFKGPITLQDGSVYVKDGAVASDKEIWYLPQLLQGMGGASAPTK